MIKENQGGAGGLEKLQVEYLNIEDLKAYEKNARTHSEEQIEQLCSSIREFGFTNPVLVDEKNELIAGHGRCTAAKKLGLKAVPAIRLKNLTEIQVKALRIADNQLALNAGWDTELLSAELATLQVEDFDMDLLGFSLEEIDGLLDDQNVIDHSAREQEVFQDEVPEVSENPIVQTGDVWLLGEHRLVCGDSTSAEDVALLMNEEKADLVFTDPPYGMKKEKDGIANDNLNFDDLLEFNKKWIPLSFANLKNTGSWYCWGIDEPLMDIYSHILKPMAKRNEITFRNLLTWDKGDAGAGGVSFMGAEGLRSYPVSDEKCLFVMCGVQGFNTNADNYFEGWEPVRKYLADEAERVGLTPKDLKDICGVGMFSHWFTKSQWTFIPENHYRKLQEHFREYGAFKREYEEIKREYYATRAYFDNTHDKMKTVWEFGRVKGEERALTGGHATPKPIALCARAIKSSSREGEIVLDLFGGSGSTLIACEQLHRKARLIELDPRYCDVIINRFQAMTGQQAIRESDGVAFDDVANKSNVT